MDIEKIVLKYALLNAVEFGEANPGAVIGKVIAENPDTKKDIKKLKDVVQKIVEEVNSWSQEKQKDELKKFGEIKLPEKKQREGLPPLPEAESRKVVMRFEPSPSGPLHIGHAYVLILNAELSKKYNGKCFVRISDTNPDNIYPDAYEMIKKDSKWLTKDFIKDEDFVIQSDRMEIYYKYAEEAIKKGVAYVCTCEPEKWRKLMLEGKACPCRDLPPEEHLERWKHMLTDWKEGEAVVRIKTDLKNKNPALRDWPALRINTSKHPLQGNKYRVWPLMNFSVAIDDHEMGITHTVHAKEHRDNAKRRKYLYDAFGWKMPIYIFIGAINFTDLKLSTSSTRKAIEEGEYSGWDDPRLPFIVALRKRGYQPEAFIKYAIEIGISERDKTVSKEEFFKMINKFNREVVDPIANRYFFVRDPVEIELDKIPTNEVEAPKHPDFPERGKRKISVSGKIFIEREDFEKYKGKEIRLMHLCNIILDKKSKVTGTELKDIKKIHWLSEDNIKVKLMMPDGSEIDGIGEKNLENVNADEVVQFERIGFARCDSEKPLIFYFAHK